MLSVPIDDESTGQYLIQYNLSAPVVVEAGPLEDSADWPPYLKGGPTEHWGQDRAAMLHGAFSGFSLHAADFAINESQGPITDRSQEFLSDSDVALIKLRRLLLDAVKEFERGGVPRIARHEDAAYTSVWVGDKVLKAAEDWTGQAEMPALQNSEC
jgi:hypothetical protein